MEKINLTDFYKRQLKKFYLVVYVITKEIKIRTDTCIKDKDVYVLFGVDIMGNRQIIGINFNNENNNRFWLEKFEDIKARKCEEILYLVTPKDRNIERCIKIMYNNVKIIHSPEEIYMGISKFFAEKPFRKIQTNFKNLFFAENKEKYTEESKMFKEIYMDNKLIMMLLEKKQNEIEEFYKYDYSMRKLLYPFFSIKEMKKQLNKIRTKDKLCTNINEVIEDFLPYINSFESARSYSKMEWWNLISNIYDENIDILEEYING